MNSKNLNTIFIPRGKRKNWENIKKALLPIIKKLNYMPTRRELHNAGLDWLYEAIYRHHGGIIKTAKKLGVKTWSEYHGKTDKGHYEDIKKVIKEYINLAVSIGNNTWPTINDILNNDKSQLLAGIRRHGGLNTIRENAEKKGYNFNRPSSKKNPLADLENLKKELIPLSNKLGHFPTKKYFFDNNLKNIYYVIVRYHGGIKKLSKKIGIPLSSDLSGKYENMKYLKSIFMPIVKEKGYLPSSKELSKTPNGHKLNSIISYLGGFEAVADRLGVKTWCDYNGKRRRGSLSDPESLVKEYVKATKKLGTGYWATASDLDSAGEGGIAYAIHVFGGFKKIRKLAKRKGYSFKKPDYRRKNL